MSWDVSVFASSIPPPPIESMPRDWQPLPLGPSPEVRATISASIPDVDWSDPTWGLFSGEGFTCEFNMGREQVIDSFMVHVRGRGDPLPLLTKLANTCGWYLLDCSTGQWLHHSQKPATGWEGFQAFRDRALGYSGNGEDK